MWIVFAMKISPQRGFTVERIVFCYEDFTTTWLKGDIDCFCYEDFTTTWLCGRTDCFSYEDITTTWLKGN
jgi:hypothetical protein